MLTGASKAMMILLMLIGGSPSSTAGGMKTTTFALLLLNVQADLTVSLYVFQNVQVRSIKYSSSSIPSFFYPTMILSIGSLAFRLFLSENTA